MKWDGEQPELMLDLFVRLQKRAKQLTIEIIDDKQADIKSDSSRCNDSEMLRSVGKVLER